MIANLKTYPITKDSGIDWLGALPTHWEVRRLAQFGNISKGSGGNKDDEMGAGVPCIRYGDLYTTHHNCIHRSRSFVSNEKAAEYTPTKFGDVLFASSGETTDEIGKSAVNLMQEDACCGGDVIIFRPTQRVDARYLGYVMDCRPIAAKKATMGRGITVIHLYGTQLKYLTIPLPPLLEQTGIAHFLDHVDRHIRRYIHAKQKLIALLEEQKQAIIHQAVTGRIDVRTGHPHRAYKDSGVDWLDDIPVHWGVVRLKFVAEKIVDCLHETPEYSETGMFPAIRTADVSPGMVSFESARRIGQQEYTRWTERLEPMPNDILYSREGERFGIAACVPEGVRLCISQRMMVFRIRAEHNPVFMMWMLNSRRVYAQACQDIMGATAPHVNVSTIRNYCFAVPGRDEQDAVVDMIESSTRGISATIASANSCISRAREYQLCLVADIVTGKLDVRDAMLSGTQISDEDHARTLPEHGISEGRVG